jgi:hypothetical protein
MIVGHVLLMHPTQNQNIVDAASLPRIGASQKVAIWRGDITMLAVDGIVNAANEWMLGLYSQWRCLQCDMH